MQREEVLRLPVGAIDLKQVSLRRCPEMDERDDGTEGTSVLYLDFRMDDGERKKGAGGKKEDTAERTGSASPSVDTKGTGPKWTLLRRPSITSR